MRFTSWLWEQVEDLGKDSGFAKVAWDDVNTGCALPTYSASDWIKHFEKKHPDTKEALVKQLFISFQEYKRSQEPK